MSDNRATELLPCPFCSAEPEVLSDGWRTWGLVQHNEGCLFPVYPKHEIPKSDFAAWNSRAERTCECVMCAYFENKSTCGAYCNYFDRELGDDYDGGCTWGVVSGCKVVGE